MWLVCTRAPGKFHRDKYLYGVPRRPRSALCSTQTADASVVINSFSNASSLQSTAIAAQREGGQHTLLRAYACSQFSHTSRHPSPDVPSTQSHQQPNPGRRRSRIGTESTGRQAASSSHIYTDCQLITARYGRDGTRMGRASCGLDRDRFAVVVYLMMTIMRYITNGKCRTGSS